MRGAAGFSWGGVAFGGSATFASAAGFASAPLGCGFAGSCGFPDFFAFSAASFFSSSVVSLTATARALDLTCMRSSESIVAFTYARLFRSVANSGLSAHARFSASIVSRAVKA